MDLKPPRFVRKLPETVDSFMEGTAVNFECQVEPINDPNLTLTWYHNGNALNNGHRFRCTHDFGYVALHILYAFPEDTGTYLIKAKNDFGEDETSVSIRIEGKVAIQLETQHPESLKKINEIEGQKFEHINDVVYTQTAPKFVGKLESITRLEGQSAHFETRITPVGDSGMVLNWFKDGYPLMAGNRIAHTYDFGFVALDILYCLPNDTGEYSITAKNDQGEDSVHAVLNVLEIPSLQTDTLHEQSLRKIIEMEEKSAVMNADIDSSKFEPRFTRKLNSCLDLIEGQPAHFEAEVEPISDPGLGILWFHNGAPITASSRISVRNEFGLVCLDILYCLIEDIGEYKCVAITDQGQATTEGQLQCVARESIYKNTLHEKSWKIIQEIEAPKSAVADAEPVVYEKPSFILPLQDISDVPEGSAATFECRVIPINDPNLRIEWYAKPTVLYYLEIIFQVFQWLHSAAKQLDNRDT
jgi:hypothetical protein